MITTIIDLLLINFIITCIFLSGFVDSVDEAIHKRFKPYHLPRPFSCNLCSVFWASAIFLLFSHQFTLLTISFALFSALLTEITAPLITLVINTLKKIVELGIRLVEKI